MQDHHTEPGGGQGFHLVQVRDSVPVTTSLVVAVGTQLDHASVILLVRKYQNDLEDFGLLDFKSESTGGRPTEYAILNQEQATLLLTYMRNTDIVRGFKKALVKAFWELARKQQDPVEALLSMTRPEMLEMAAGMARERATLRTQNATQAATIATLAPKAEFADRVSNSKDVLTFKEFAKVLGTGQNRFTAWLREIEVLLRYSTEPYQSHVDAGYFRVEERTTEDGSGRDRLYTKTLITGKGQLWLQKKWDARGAK